MDELPSNQASQSKQSVDQGQSSQTQENPVLDSNYNFERMEENVIDETPPPHRNFFDKRKKNKFFKGKTNTKFFEKMPKANAFPFNIRLFEKDQIRKKLFAGKGEGGSKFESFDEIIKTKASNPEDYKNITQKYKRQSKLRQELRKEVREELRKEVREELRDEAYDEQGVKMVVPRTRGNTANSTTLKSVESFQDPLTSDLSYDHPKLSSIPEMQEDVIMESTFDAPSAEETEYYEVTMKPVSSINARTPPDALRPLRVLTPIVIPPLSLSESGPSEASEASNTDSTPKLLFDPFFPPRPDPDHHYPKPPIDPPYPFPIGDEPIPIGPEPPINPPDPPPILQVDIGNANGNSEIEEDNTSNEKSVKNVTFSGEDEIMVSVPEEPVSSAPQKENLFQRAYKRAQKFFYPPPAPNGALLPPGTKQEPA